MNTKGIYDRIRQGPRRLVAVAIKYQWPRRLVTVSVAIVKYTWLRDLGHGYLMVKVTKRRSRILTVTGPWRILSYTVLSQYCS